MTTIEWVQDLVQEGWQFWAHEGALRYRAPKDAAAPHVLERLRAHRDEILDVAVRTPDELALGPLSYGQRALWFLWALAPNSSAYHQSLPLRVPDSADPLLWRQAAHLLVGRHPMLRTRFPIRRGEPVQQPRSVVALAWSEANARDWSESELNAAMVSAHGEPFDLATQPPIRFQWFTRGERPVLLITMHHVACDAWSLEMLRRELGAIVQTLADGRPWTAVPPAHTYQEFVRWQRAMLASPAGERLWDFWRDRLADPRAQLELPIDRPRPAVQAYHGSSVKMPISSALASRLRALAQAQQVTLHALLLAAFLTFLYRWTRQKDLVIGMPTVGRSQPEFAGIIGYFVEPVVLRMTVSDDHTFAAFLAGVKRASRDALAHSDFPFALLVERLRVERDPSRSPIFDVTFNFLSRRAASAETGRDAGDTRRILDMPQADGKFDLTLTVVEDEAEMSAALGFNTDLFERATIDRVAGVLVHVLEEVTRDPTRRLDAIPLASTSRPTPALTGRSLDLNTLRTVHEQIAEWAVRTPHATAVVAKDGQLTYAELFDRASRLAARLSTEGVRPDTPVGLVTSRSTEFVVGLLAILLAGGAYLPLDPALPTLVRGRMLRRAGARISVVGAGLEEGALTGMETMVSIGDLEAAPRQTAADPHTLDRLAYVMFTSGSTGEPKGVGVEHRALSNYLASLVEKVQVESGARHAFVSTISADLGHTAVFASLVTGGALHVLSEDTVTDRALFARYMRDHAIDYLKITPSHLAALIDACDPVLPRRALILGGEPVPSAWVASLQRAGECRVFNHYGPTEATVGVMMFAADESHSVSTATLPLDWAVANVEVWLLDTDGQPVPVGVPGEVYVGGPCLARGYVGDAERTAERFVTGPGGTRVYRTGDLARQLNDGGLLLLGREDRQLKLRGYRLELGHIEQALVEHPGVRHAVVLPDRDGPEASTLLAWIVPASAPASPAFSDTLRRWLVERIPHYMVPALLTLVDQVPLTANGKTDVRALRAMRPVAATRTHRVAARDLVELQLCRIWSQVLGVSDVEVTDDFFQLGGHSLLAVRMAGLIADQFGQRVPLATLFTHRTVEQLAAVIRTATASTRSAPLVPMQPDGHGSPLILFPGAGGSLLSFQYLLTALDRGVPVWGVQSVGLDDEQVALDIPSMASVYVDAIEQQWRGASELHLVGHSFGALVAFEVARQLLQRGIPVAQVGIIDNPAPTCGEEADTANDNRDWLLHIAARIERLYGVDLGLERGEPSATTVHEGDWLVDRLLASGVLPPDTTRAYFARWVDFYRANVLAAARYRPNGASVDIALTLFKAAEADPGLERPTVTDPSFGWASYCVRPVTVIEVPGTHITMLTEPHVRVLAGHIRAARDVADGHGRYA